MAVVVPSSPHCQTYPYPEFFKLYVPDHSSDKLHVPPTFVLHLYGRGQLLPDTIFLRTSRRRHHHHQSMIWEVEVNQRENEADGVFFNYGWGRFVRDLSLELGDLLTFRFDGDCTFYVTVFGPSMMEKEQFLGSDDGGDAAAADDDEIDVASYVVSTNNPYFVTKVRNGSHQSSLHVPWEMLLELKARDLKMDGTVILCDSDGKRWTGNVTTWTDGRMWIRGWNVLSKKNSLGANDRCICELVVQEGQKTVSLIQVHIVRA